MSRTEWIVVKRSHALGPERPIILYAKGEDHGPYAIGSNFQLFRQWDRPLGGTWADVYEQASATFDLIVDYAGDSFSYRDTAKVAEAVRAATEQAGASRWRRAAERRKTIETWALRRLAGFNKVMAPQGQGTTIKEWRKARAAVPGFGDVF